MEKYKRVEKGYCVNLSLIQEGYMTDTIGCSALNINKAKSKLLAKLLNEGWELNSCEEELTYTTVPVIRYPKYDTYEFDGKVLILSKIEEVLKERERDDKLDSMLLDESIKYCYIRKGSYYKPESRGYTEFKNKAGVFTKEEAVSEAKWCNAVSIIPIDIEIHNKMIEEEIKDLQIKLLK